MKKLAIILLTLSILTAELSKAQNCPSNPTYSNQNGTFELSSGRSIVINDGKAYNVTVQTTFAPNATVCVLNGSTLNLSFSSVNAIASGGKIYVDKNAKLTFTGGGFTNVPLTITNNGTVTQQGNIIFSDGAVITNTGTYNATGSILFNNGTISLTNSGTFSFSGGNTFNSGAFTITNTATGKLTFSQDVVASSLVINNQGNTTVNGDIIVQDNAAINNDNIFNINGSGNLTANNASVTNKGVMYVYGTTVINGQATFTNSCTFKGYGSFTTNASTVSNTGSILLDITSTKGTFTNSGTFTNGASALVQGTTFTNNSTITGGGNFYFSGTTNNNGTFAGTSGNNKINFYDASPSNNNVFDIQTTKPSLTTSNAISPNTATTFVSCTDVTSPVITTQPLTQNFCTIATNSATFTVAATSNTAPSYQWYKNGVAISGATSTSYTATGLTLADTASNFTVAVKNTFGITTSNAASVNYIIVAQPSPSSLNLATGSAATFTVKASDVVTAYQWQRNGGNIGGANAAVYSDGSVALNEAGSYTAVLTYPGGTCTTAAATLTVENLPSITAQPSSVVYCTTAAGTTATFSVTAATSVSALSYQWYKNGAAITGATAASYTATGLTLADTASNYYVILKNGVGTTQSNAVSVDYIIYAQPVSVSAYPGSAASFTVKASNVKSYQWQKNTSNIGGGAASTLSTYTDASVAVADSGSYRAVVTYNATSSYPSGTCTTNAATLSILGLPLIVTQPLTQTICNSTTTSATFSVVATSNVAAGTIANIALSYQWYKKDQAIAGATAASYTATGLTLADTANPFYVKVTNSYGSVTSNTASVNYIILSQPSGLYLATGNAASFSIKTSGATSLTWMKNGVNISGATALSYALPVVNYADSGSYAALVTYPGGVCTSNPASLKTSVVLYSTAHGDLTNPNSWGVNLDGTGSTPVNFLRDEHTFVVINQAKNAATLGHDLTIAGTLDIASTNVALHDNTTLTVGRIIRSLAGGMLGASEKDSIIIKGIPSTPGLDSSDLYFDPASNTAQRLVISGSNVALHTALNITNNNGNQAGSNGVVQITGGTLYTNDSLTLKSNNLGTGSIASSTGTIAGKVTVEKYITNKRSWRLMGAPVSSTGAPTIHDSYQEGAVSSTDNPHPGYGTHITYGALTDGYDQNPQKSFSMKVLNSAGSWVGVPAPNKTRVTDYPAYMFFIRGNRSYPITSTTTSTAASATVLRVTGYLNQGTLAAQTVAATGTTLVVNPYACPINFTKVVGGSTNLKARIRMWDPSLAGTKGVGGWVTVDGTSGTYKATPPSTLLTLIQAGQGFYVESGNGTTTGSMVMSESVKDLSTITTSNDRMGDDMAADTSLEVDLKIMNADSSFSVADGVLYHFNAADNDSVDTDDATKIANFYENLSINEKGTPLTIDARTVPSAGDSLKLNLSGFTASTYQLQIVPSFLPSDKLFSVYDSYLNTLTPISAGDTTLVTFSVSSAVAASKAANRFSIVVSQTKFLLPVTFTKVKAYRENKAVVVAWTVENESGVASYEVEKSATGTAPFSKMGSVTATGARAYSFSDAAPLGGMNYYRVKSVDRSGAIHYTSVVNVNVTAAGTSGAAAVSVYPNPVTGNFFNLTLTNLEAGSYTLSVTNSKGTAVFSTVIAHTGGTASYKVAMNQPLPAGTFFLSLAAHDGSVTTTKIITL